MCIFGITVIAYLLNIIGLILDMYGVYKLFYTKETGLGKVDLSVIHIKSPVIPSDDDTEVDKILNDTWYRAATVKEMFVRLNERIDQVQDDNKSKLELSKIWLGYIIWGFSLSLLSVLLQLVCFLCHTYG